MRTIEEIKVRIESEKKNDILGLAISDLMEWDADCYKEECRHECPDLSTMDEIVRKAIVDYLPFAFEKCENERGLSAGRSVMHLANWAWLLGRDDLVEFAQDGSNYPMYGRPILERFAKEFGYSAASQGR